jgi:polyisoprenoid-binding protein YceI
MKLRNVLFALVAPAAFLLQSAPADEAAVSASTPGAVPAGAYTLDKAHASLTFRVDHLGFSNYTARFKRFDAQLQFDPADVTASSVTATIDPRSLDLDSPPAGFTEALLGEQWLDAAKFSQMTFHSTKVESTGANTFRITGNFTLHGVTQPVVLDATYNGGYEGHPMDPHARIGFSAHGSLLRSAFGIAYGIPAPGTTMGVSDQVDVIIEAEFSGPPFVGAPPGQTVEKQR